MGFKLYFFLYVSRVVLQINVLFLFIFVKVIRFSFVWDFLFFMGVYDFYFA